MILKIGICDDEPNNIEEIRSQLVDYEMKHDIDFEISTFSSSRDLLKIYTAPGLFHILFLDVEMPEVNGIDLANQIRRLPDRKVKIIFISNYPEYMKDSFNVQAFHYLSKPFSADKCTHILKQILDDLEQTRTVKLLPHLDGTEELVYLDEVIQIQGVNAKNKELRVIRTNSSTLCRGLISDWEKDLSDYGFISPSRGILINIHHLHYFKDKNITLSNGDCVPLSRRKEKSIRDLFNKHLLIHQNR